MSGEETEETVSVDVSADLADWLDEQADDEDVAREDVLRDLLAAYRTVAADNGQLADEVRVAGEGSVSERLDEQREEYMDLIEDVRQRVIQVKREADAKAATDHDHPELSETVEDAAERLAELEADLDELDEAVDGLGRDLDSGFENYRDVLTYLKDAVEDAEQRLDVLARAVVEVRSVSREVAATDGARIEAERLQREANRNGFRKADCDDCGATLDLALLSRPECPHCSAAFVDVEPKRGLLGSNHLVTGEVPAIEGRIGEDDDLSEMVAEADEREHDPEVEWSRSGSEPT